jgi:hypothetical protein
VTFLELCQKLRSEAVVSGSGPVSVTTATGIERRIVNWVNDAWMEIQTRNPDWLFMADEFEFETIAGTTDYSPSALSLQVGRWSMDSITCQDTLASESLLTPVEYYDYRRQLKIGPQTQSRPQYVTQSPNMALTLWPTPNKGYTVKGQYYRAPSLMVNNDDVPGMPEQYHMAIVYLAMQYYGRSEAAMEILADGATRYRPLIGRMEIEQLPEINMGGPLA